jgi:O-antigen/teichoic acid export membrane protein
MRLKFFSHLILIVLLNLLVKPIAIFGIDANVQNEVGALEYGIYFSLLNFTYLFNILLDFGITNFNIKYIAQYPHLAKQYIGKIIPLRLFLFLIYVFITLVFAFLLSYNEKQYQILYYLIFNQFLISVILFFRSYFSGLLMLKTDIILSVLDKFILIVLMSYFLFFQNVIKISIINYVQIQTISLSIACFLCLILILVRVGIPKIKINFAFNKLILKKSIPYALLIVLMMLYNRVDSVMLERILPESSLETGIYAQAFRLLDALFMFASLFSSLLFPIFSNMLKAKQNIIPLLYSSSSLLFSSAIIIIIILMFNSEFLMNLVYKNEVKSSACVLKFLIISFLPLCVTIIFGTLLTANGNLRFLNIVSSIGILFNVVFNYLLIPEYGAIGATITSLITQTIVALIYVIHTFKLFKIKILFIDFSKFIFFIILLFTFAYFTQNYLSNLLFIASILVISLAYLLLSNLIQWRLLLDLLKKKK